MSDKSTVRIIKRSERDGRAKRAAERAAESAARPSEPEKASTDLTTTVTTWVEEFRHRQKRERGRTFKKLFDDTAPAGETSAFSRLETP